MADMLSIVSSWRGVSLHVFIWIVAGIKIFEIAKYTWWVIQRGHQYRDELLKFIADQGTSRFLAGQVLADLDHRHGVPWPMLWRLDEDFFGPVLSPALRFIRQWIYRQPSIVLILSLLVIWSSTEHCLIVGDMFMLFFLICSELLDVLCARAILGFADNFRQDFARDPTSTYKLGVHWSKAGFLGTFVFGIGIFLASSTVGFGAIYYGAYCLDENAFIGLLKPGTEVLQLMYFSVATMATVGYGDIHPGTVFVQMIAASEIIFGTSVIVFLLFTLSNTFSPD